MSPNLHGCVVRDEPDGFCLPALTANLAAGALLWWAVWKAVVWIVRLT